MHIKQSIIKTLVSGAISILIAGSAMAAEIDEPVTQTLTLKEAVERAMDREEKVNVLDKQILANEERLDVIDDPTVSSYYSVVYSMDEASQQKELIKDIVTYNTTVLYDGIIMSQRKITTSTEAIKIAEQKLRQAEIKNMKGLISEFDLSQVQIQLEKQKAEQKQNELTLSDYKSQFLTLTGINVDEYEELEDDLSYEPLNYNEGVEGLISWNVGFYMENTEKFMEYQRNHIIEITQAQYGDTGLPVDVVDATEAEVAESSYNTSQKRKNMTQSLRTCAAELEKLQQTIKTQETDIKNEQVKLAKTKINYKAGNITQLDLKEAEQAVLQLEIAREQNIHAYQEQKMILEKPWVKY